jgi:hypothetical protein
VPISQRKSIACRLAAKKCDRWPFAPCVHKNLSSSVLNVHACESTYSKSL